MSDPAVKKAVTALEFLSQDERERALYEDRQKALRDWNSSILSATEEGLEKGRKEGLEQGLELGLEQGRRAAQQALVQKLLAAGFPPADIAKWVEWPVAEVEHIRQAPQ